MTRSDWPLWEGGARTRTTVREPLPLTVLEEGLSVASQGAVPVPDVKASRLSRRDRTVCFYLYMTTFPGPGFSAQGPQVSLGCSNPGIHGIPGLLNRLLGVSTCWQEFAQ